MSCQGLNSLGWGCKDLQTSGGARCALEVILVAVGERLGNGDGLEHIDGAHFDGQQDDAAKVGGHGEPPGHSLVR